MTRPEKEVEIGAQLEKIFADVNSGPHIQAQMVRIGGGVINMLANVALGLYEIADALREARRG